MNQEELQKKIVEYYEKLTPEAQEVFSSMKWLEILETISEKYKLTEEKNQTLGTETMLVLLGIINIVEYETIIWDNLGLSEKTARDLFSEIDNAILKEIRPQLTKAFYQNNKPTTEKLNEMIKEGMVKLPKETRETIENFGWEKITEEVAKKYSLNEIQIIDLKNQIGLILTEIVELDFIALSIENNLNIDKEKALKISEEVIQQIFIPILKNLENIIKKNLNVKNIHWQQNLDFILSGGDYTAFIRRVEEKKEEIPKENITNRGKINDLRETFTI